MIDRYSHVVILPFMVERLHLRGNELIIYAIIFQYSQDGECLYRDGIPYLAEWTKLRNDEICRILNDLIRRGLIRAVEISDGGNKEFGFCVIM